MPIYMIVWLTACFVWLLYETDWMRVRLQIGGDIAMRLPTGKILTREELEYVIKAIKPTKPKVNSAKLPCWYCGNGNARQHHTIGGHPFDLCDCGASIIIWSKKKRTRKMPYAKLAGEVNAIMRANYNPAVAARYKTKRLV